ncbi:MAG: hypothetical protein V7638_1852 [Acidobacteriota bacterium]
MITKLKSIKRVICYLSCNTDNTDLNPDFYPCDLWLEINLRDHIVNQFSRTFFTLRLSNNTNDGLGI